MRVKVRTGKCLSCEVDFSSVKKAFRHIAYKSSRCKQFYSENISDMTNDRYEPFSVCDYFNDQNKTASSKFVCPAFRFDESIS